MLNEIKDEFEVFQIEFQITRQFMENHSLKKAAFSILSPCFSNRPGPSNASCKFLEDITPLIFGARTDRNQYLHVMSSFLAFQIQRGSNVTQENLLNFTKELEKYNTYHEAYQRFPPSFNANFRQPQMVHTYILLFKSEQIGIGSACSFLRS